MHLKLLFIRIVLYKVKILNVIEASRRKKKHLKNDFEKFPVLMVFIYYTAIKGLLRCSRNLTCVKWSPGYKVSLRDFTCQ